MDLDFYRALSNIGPSSGPICILRRDNKIVVCQDLDAVYFDVAEINEPTFATGWQNGSGASGQWHTWNQVDTYDQASVRREFSPVVPIVESSDWSSSLNHEQFVSAVNSMRDDMARGEYFLANLTRIVQREGSFDETYIALLGALVHDTPFRFFHRDEEKSVVGFSPERFLHIDNNIVITQPMKGTARHEDELLRNSKEHEENTMMIDLVRSDLSRICVPASIIVRERDTISLHPGLAQMNSTLQGTLSNHNVTGAIRHMMPVASVTGTPKPYVEKKIGLYENRERDIYCGAYGWVDTATQQCDLAVGIRTIVIDKKSVRVGTGAGITFHSDAESEWNETELKASRLTSLVNQSVPAQASSVFTSLRVNESGQFFHLEKHCERLSRHAKFLGIHVSTQDITSAAREHLQSKETSLARLQITIASHGDIRCTTQPFLPSLDSLTMGIAPAPFLDIDVPKYIDRSIYSRSLDIATALASQEIDDTFLVVRGKVTETTRTNFFVRKGHLISTPPLEGNISGVARLATLHYLNDQGVEVTERDHTVDDLVTADEIVLTNSVRGATSVSKISHALFDSDIEFHSDDNLLNQARVAFEIGFS